MGCVAAGLLPGAKGIADAQGKWLVRLEVLPAGGPHTMTVSGPQTAEVRNVMVGDVWICSGQSNLQMPVGGAMNAPTEIAAARHPRIRFFKVPWAGLRPGGPQVMHTEPQETVGGFSAVGYFFARELQLEVEVPRCRLWNKAGLPAAPFEIRITP